MTVTATQFLSKLKSRVTLPANDELLTDPKLLEIGDDVIRDKMVSLMLSVNENYFAVTTGTDLVEAQEYYNIPYRAIGRTLRELKLVQNSSAAEADDSNTSDMHLIALEDEQYWNHPGKPHYFYFEGDRFVVRPVPQTSDHYLKIWYDLQPGLLCQVTDAALVDSVASNVVSVTGAVPSTMTAGVEVDFIQGRQGCRTLGMDAQITNVAGTQITFASADDIPSTLREGDWISIGQTSPVIQFPDEALPLIVTLAAAQAMHAIGDFEAQAKLEEEAMKKETALLKLIAPRIQGENKKIVNRRGLLRGQGFGSRRGYGHYP